MKKVNEKGLVLVLDQVVLLAPHAIRFTSEEFSVLESIAGAATGFESVAKLCVFLLEEVEIGAERLEADLRKWAAYNDWQLAAEMLHQAFGITPWLGIDSVSPKKGHLVLLADRKVPRAESTKAPRVRLPENEEELVVQVEAWIVELRAEKQGLSSNDETMLRRCVKLALEARGADLSILATALEEKWEEEGPVSS